jgi:hypothetical protein
MKSFISNSSLWQSFSQGWHAESQGKDARCQKELFEINDLI